MLDEIARVTVHLFMRYAIEVEVDTFLDQRPYERRSEDTLAGRNADGFRGLEKLVDVVTV